MMLQGIFMHLNSGDDTMALHDDSFITRSTLQKHKKEIGKGTCKEKEVHHSGTKTNYVLY